MSHDNKLFILNLFLDLDLYLNRIQQALAYTSRRALQNNLLRGFGIEGLPP